MNRDRILQVRLDRDLARSLAAHVKRLRAGDPRASESMAARLLLREALDRQHGQPLAAADAGFQEGMRRGYDEIRRAITEAVRPLLGKGGES